MLFFMLKLLTATLWWWRALKQCFVFAVHGFMMRIHFLFFVYICLSQSFPFLPSIFNQHCVFGRWYLAVWCEFSDAHSNHCFDSELEFHSLILHQHSKFSSDGMAVFSLSIFLLRFDVDFVCINFCYSLHLSFDSSNYYNGQI